MINDMSGVQFNLVETFDDAEAYMRWLSEDRNRRCLAFDTETGGLEFWKQPLRLVQFGDTMTGWAIPWERWGGLVDETFRRYEGRYVAHNLPFDLKFLEHNGVKLPHERLNDTMTMAHLIDPTLSVALKSLGARIVTPAVRAGEQQLKSAMHTSGWTWSTIPIDFEPYWVYAALDTVITARLEEHFWPEISTTFREAYELEIACELVLAAMERRGMRIDLEYTNTKLAEFRQYVASTRAWCTEQYGVENPTSNAQVIARLQQDGVTLTKKTATGNPSLDEEVLQSLDHPLAKAVLNIRKVSKICSTYFENFLEMHDGGILHPSVRFLGARTGRMSISSPALQTLPRKSPVVRDCFIPRDGNKLMMADFDQIELRLLAHFANEGEMIRAIREGRDLHTHTAQLVYNLGDQEPEREMRQLAKNAGFAKIFGAGVDTFARTAGVDVDVARDFLARYDQTYPGVRAFQKQVEVVAKQRLATEGMAYVIDPFGRRQVADEGAIYKLVNYLIQGCAAGILKKKIVELDMAGLGDNMLLPVHDEIIFDVPEGEVEDARTTILDTMSETQMFQVPLSVGVDVADRWGQKYA